MTSFDTPKIPSRAAITSVVRARAHREYGGRDFYIFFFFFIYKRTHACCIHFSFWPSWPCLASRSSPTRRPCLFCTVIALKFDSFRRRRRRRVRWIRSVFVGHTHRTSVCRAPCSYRPWRGTVLRRPLRTAKSFGRAPFLRTVRTIR